HTGAGDIMNKHPVVICCLLGESGQRVTDRMNPLRTASHRSDQRVAADIQSLPTLIVGMDCNHDSRWFDGKQTLQGMLDHGFSGEQRILLGHIAAKTAADTCSWNHKPKTHSLNISTGIASLGSSSSAGGGGGGSL